MAMHGVVENLAADVHHAISVHHLVQILEFQEAAEVVLVLWDATVPVLTGRLQVLRLLLVK
jgi:hypothetical protein